MTCFHPLERDKKQISPALRASPVFMGDVSSPPIGGKADEVRIGGRLEDRIYLVPLKESDSRECDPYAHGAPVPREAGGRPRNREVLAKRQLSEYL